MRTVPRAAAAIVAAFATALTGLILVKINADESPAPEEIAPIVITPSQPVPTFALTPGFDVEDDDDDKDDDDDDEYGKDDVGDDEDDGDFNRITPEPRDLDDNDDDD